MAIIQRWKISVYNPNTYAWSVPNEVGFRNPGTTNIEITETSTGQIIDLADGSEGFILPTTKYISDPLVFEWHNIESGATNAVNTNFIDNIRDYVKNSSGIRLTMHTSEVLEGRFTKVTRIMEPCKDYRGGVRFTVNAEFKPIAILSGMGI